MSPDDVEIEILTQDDFVGMLLVRPSGVIDVKVNAGRLGPADFCSILLTTAAHIMHEGGISFDAVKNSSVIAADMPPHRD